MSSILIFTPIRWEKILTEQIQFINDINSSKNEIEIEFLEYNQIETFLKTFENIKNMKNKTINQNFFIIPTSDLTAKQLCQDQKFWQEKKVGFLTCPFLILNSLSNKVQLAQIPNKPEFEELKEYLPVSYFIYNHSTFNENQNKEIKEKSVLKEQDIKYPCLIKADVGEWGKTVKLLPNERYLIKYFPFFEDKSFVIQECIINDEEWSTQMLVYNGKILYHATKLLKMNQDKFVRPYVKIVETKTDVKINEQTLNIFKKFVCNYSGFINVNYKYSFCTKNKTETLKILEFNTRLAANCATMNTNIFEKMIFKYINLSIQL